MASKEESTKANSARRCLELYARFCQGKVVNKAACARSWGIDERSVQRDIDTIRAFLSEHKELGEWEIVYQKPENGFVMKGRKASWMSKSEILAVSKILLASRAFAGKEMGEILEKLILGCVPEESGRLVSDLISNERYHYTPLRHAKEHPDIGIQDRLWEIGVAIKEQQLLEIAYHRAVDAKETKKRLVVEPMAILFSEYYFYLNAFIVEEDESGKYVHKYDYPAIFRFDRIAESKRIGKSFPVVYANRFEEGEFRKRIQFMYAGRLMTVQLWFYGNSAEPILDRLPTAEIVKEEAGRFLIKAEVYGKGILMWLMSQGDRVEVIRPEKLREEMKQLLIQKLKQYEDGEEAAEEETAGKRTET